MCTGAETQRQKMDADRCDWSDRDVDGYCVDGMLLFRQHIHDSTAWHFDTAPVHTHEPLPIPLFVSLPASEPAYIAASLSAPVPGQPEAGKSALAADQAPALSLEAPHIPPGAR